MYFSSLSRSLLDQCGGSGRPQDLGQLRAVAGIAWSDHPFTSCRGMAASADERTTESIPATRTSQRVSNRVVVRVHRVLAPPPPPPLTLK